jgi:hypothetical protein
MPQRFILAVKAVLAGGLVLALALPAPAQGPKPPQWSHAFNLKCRNSKQQKFDMARTFGMEVFRDDNNGKGIYIIETGVLAAVPDLNDFKGPGVTSRAPAWLHGLDLKVRPAGVEDFGKARIFGLEVFRDENTGNWIYIDETGGISVTPGGRGFTAVNPPKAPVWMHGLDLKVRKAGEKGFDKDTKVWSIEIFRDENNGNLIYICESGMLAVVPGDKDAPAPTVKAVAPAWLHGLDLKVRRGGQKDFDGQTKTYGLEVFRDDNNGNLIYISETGSLSVVPGKKALAAPTKDPSQPAWTHGLDLKCRLFDKKDFDKTTPLYGIEVFTDDNTGCIIYICETGAITAVPKQ